MTMKYDRHGYGDDSDTNGNGNDDDDNFANQRPTKYVQYYQSFNHLIHPSIYPSITKQSPSSPASIKGIGGIGVSSRVCTNTDGEGGPDTPSALTE